MKIEAFIITIQNPRTVKNYFTKRLAGNFFNISVISGNTCDVVNIDFDLALSQRKYKRDLRVGEINCTKAHFTALKLAAFGQNDWCLVLEDDALISTDLPQFITEILGCSLNDTPTIILLGHSKTVSRHLWFQNLKQYKALRFKTPNFEIVQRHNANFCGTVGYIANSKAAGILSNQDKLSHVADDWLFISKRGINVLHLSVPIIYEALNDQTSSTGNKVFIHHDPFSSNWIREWGSAIKAQIHRIYTCIFQPP